MGKESGTQFLKALKDAIGESAIDGEARRGVEREQEARIKADNELSAAIDDEKEARIEGENDLRGEIEKAVQYGSDWEFTKLPDGLEAEWLHTLGPEFNSDVACKLTATKALASGEYECALSWAGFAQKTYTRAGIAGDTIVWGSHTAGGVEITAFAFEQTSNAASASFTLHVYDGIEAGSVLYITISDGVSETLVDAIVADEAESREEADGKLEDALGGKPDTTRGFSTMKGMENFAYVRCATYNGGTNFPADGSVYVYISKDVPEGTQWTLTVEPQWGNACAWASLAYVHGTNVTRGDFDLVTLTSTDWWQFSGTAPIDLEKGDYIVITPLATLPQGIVQTENLQVKAVTTAKIADNAVGTDQLGYGVVTKAKMGEASVGTEELADGSVTKAKLSSSLGFIATPNTSVSLNANESRTVTLNTTANIPAGEWFHIINTYGLDNATSAYIAFGTYAPGTTRITVRVTNNTDSVLSFNLRVALIKDTLFS